jgi:hypothetical protein
MIIRLQTLGSEVVVSTSMPLGWNSVPDGIHFQGVFYSRIGIQGKLAIYREGTVQTLAPPPAVPA